MIALLIIFGGLFSCAFLTEVANGEVCCPAGDFKCNDGSCMTPDRLCRYPAACTSLASCCAGNNGTVCGSICAPNDALTCCNPSSGHTCDKNGETCCGATCCGQDKPSCCSEQSCCGASEVCCSGTCCAAGSLCAAGGGCCSEPCESGCCGGGQVCTGHSGASASGSMCCSPGQVVSAGHCCDSGSMFLSSDGCCPLSLVCNGRCCASSSPSCASPSGGGTGICCASGQTNCNGQCCGGECCSGTCCASGSNCLRDAFSGTGHCCQTGEVLQGGTCCPSADACNGSGVCCAGSGQSCSGDGSRCCSANEPPCDGSCCPSGQTCQTDEHTSARGCCPPGQTLTGGVCCSAGETSRNGHCCRLNEILAEGTNDVSICCDQNQLCNNASGHEICCGGQCISNTCCGSQNVCSTNQGSYCCSSGDICTSHEGCCPPSRSTTDGRCCPFGSVASGVNCCSAGTVPSNGDCCPPGRTYAVSDNKCCRPGDPATGGYCCSNWCDDTCCHSSACTASGCCSSANNICRDANSNDIVCCDVLDGGCNSLNICQKCASGYTWSSELRSCCPTPKSGSLLIHCDVKSCCAVGNICEKPGSIWSQCHTTCQKSSSSQVDGNSLLKDMLSNPVAATALKIQPPSVVTPAGLSCYNTSLFTGDPLKVFPCLEKIANCGPYGLPVAMEQLVSKLNSCAGKFTTSVLIGVNCQLKCFATKLAAKIKALNGRFPCCDDLQNELSDFSSNGLLYECLVSSCGGTFCGAYASGKGALGYNCLFAGPIDIYSFDSRNCH